MMRSTFIAVLAALPATAQPQFTPIEIPVHEYTGGWEHFVGGGVAVFDCNGDNKPDILAAGGSNPSSLFINTSEAHHAVTFAASDFPEITDTTGAYPIDIDDDGNIDLVTLRVGPNSILRGDGQCGFAPMDIGFTSDARWTTAFSATWPFGQTRPTLAFGNYVDRNDPNGPFEACDDNKLYIPQGDRYTSPQTLTPSFCTLSMLFSDWGRRGRADLRVSNDRHYYVKGGQEQMWAMETPPRLFTVAEGWAPFAIWGMGIASRDMTGDGRADVFLSSMGDQKFQSLTSSDRPTFADATYDFGTTAHRPHTGDDGRPSTGWHVALGDVTNDGRDDIFIAKGNVEQMPSAAMKDPNTLLTQQADGTFLETSVEAGVASLHRGRGAAFADFNLDGLLDLVVVNRRAPLEIYENTAQDTGNWVAVDLLQDPPNRNAVGAFIELRNGEKTWIREITVGGGHAGGTHVPEHFGLGDIEQIELRVVWPDQTKSDWVAAPVNQMIRITNTGITTPDIDPVY